MTRTLENQDSGMDLRDLLSDSEFRQRASSDRADRRFEALEQLARTFSETPAIVLQKLVDIAVEFCGADSAGISLEEQDAAGELRFRWIAVAGSFGRYLNGTTPRFYSPCGTCLNSGRAQLYRVTQPYYDFLGVEADPIHDGILIPWVSGEIRGTIWAVSHRSGNTFDFNDYALLNSLADFASTAVRYQYQQEMLREQERLRASAARANELAHQINNPLQTLANVLFLAAQGDEQTGLYVKQATEELERLSELVARLVNPDGAEEPQIASLDNRSQDHTKSDNETAA
jgi:two-component sensor histidine kinase